jgi:alkanesulfonate monooxygenase SsuD/methylene tetrahydromethanopterin reductase-like flavin-dependent oxidoreductase (luciferase family)
VRIGVHLAPCRTDAVGEATRSFALAADGLGYDRVWACEHDGAPLDALTSLAFLAALTERVALGVMVRADNWQRSHLVDALATLQALSGGRLTAAVERGGADASLPILERAGSGGAGPSPPQLLVTASSPRALDRIAEHATGWLIDGTAPHDAIAGGFDRIRRAAVRSGRDPDTLQVVARVNLSITALPAGPNRARFEGSVDQVMADLDALGAVGVDEVVLLAAGRCGLDVALETYATVAEALGLASRNALRGPRLT